MKLMESERLLKRALEVIPLGSQTFSKSHQQFVRGACPQLLRSGKGARVVDVDGNSYIDYVLGLMPIVLGYCDPDVDRAIVDQLGRGITFSLPTELEADLAERLVRIIPCAEKVRFGKNGSDATSAAIRLARAATGRDRVLACGYHGWHDWYIGTTSRSAGIPPGLRDLTRTVPYNNAEAVADILRKDPDGYAAVILEPVGVAEPAPGYLEALREITARYGVLLVFDEIVTGFRVHLGGAQAHYGVTPDLACFGKAMANGMPISAVVGGAKIMGVMDDIFFSGTFGGEALSLAAAIATIDKLEREDGVGRLKRLGARLIAATNERIAAAGLARFIAAGGSDWWPRWKIAPSGIDNNLMISLLRQFAAQNGLLILATFNLCLAHDRPDVEAETLAAIARCMAALKEAVESQDPRAHLKGAMVQPTFTVRAP